MYKVNTSRIKVFPALSVCTDLIENAFILLKGKTTTTNDLKSDMSKTKERVIEIKSMLGRT